MSGGLRSSATNNAKFQKEFDNVVNAMDIVGFLEQVINDLDRLIQ